MKPILIVYATREGHTAAVAEFLAGRIRMGGVPATVLNANRRASDFLLPYCSAVVVAGSVHVGKHEPEIYSFVRRNLAHLSGTLTGFVSVSLSQAAAQDDDASPRRRTEAAADVQRMIREFLEETHWTPTLVQPLAGALMYRRYNFVIRFLMKRIAQKAGGNTDTAQNHVYTRWQDLQTFAGLMVEQVLQATLPNAATQHDKATGHQRGHLV